MFQRFRLWQSSNCNIILPILYQEYPLLERRKPDCPSKEYPSLKLFLVIWKLQHHGTDTSGSADPSVAITTRADQAAYGEGKKRDLVKSKKP
jgi:hypothetical protein